MLAVIMWLVYYLIFCILSRQEATERVLGSPASCDSSTVVHATVMITRDSSGDEIANVNFLYDDIVHALQYTVDWCINSATDRRGYVLEHRFTEFGFR